MGRPIPLLNMICMCQMLKGTKVQEKTTQQSQEEQVETQHHPQFHMNKVQSSEMGHSINALLKNADKCNINSDVHKKSHYEIKNPHTDI